MSELNVLAELKIKIHFNELVKYKLKKLQIIKKI